MRRLQWLGFAVFCLLAGSRWLVDGALPSALPMLEEQGLHAVVACGVAGVILFGRRTKAAGWASGVRLAMAGLLLLGLPMVLLAVAHAVASQTGAALFALVPLCVVVGATAIGSEAAGRGLMMPALVGLAGALLLLPFALPATVYGGLLFVVVLVAVALSAAGSVWMHALLQDWDVAPAVAVVCGANAAVLGVAALGSGGVVRPVAPDLLRCALEVPLLFLLVWLLRELPPVRFSARYLVAPLLTTVEGAVLLRQGIDWRMGMGMVLMTVGTGALLLASGREADGAGLRLS